MNYVYAHIRIGTPARCIRYCPKGRYQMNQPRIIAPAKWGSKLGKRYCDKDTDDCVLSEVDLNFVLILSGES